LTGYLVIAALIFTIGFFVASGSRADSVEGQLLSATPADPSADYWHAKATHRLERWDHANRHIVKLKAKLRHANQRIRILRRRLHPPAPKTAWYVTKQIWAANILGRESAGDPWPNCPDPYDGGGSWQDTVNCENGGSWLDSPGYYRCGLQFDPGWERRFGRLCP